MEQGRRSMNIRQLIKNNRMKIKITDPHKGNLNVSGSQSGMYREHIKLVAKTPFSTKQHKLVSSLVGCPTVVLGYFDCSSNDNLTSLRGCPKTITGIFDFSDTKIKTWEYGPEYVGGDVYINGLIQNFIGCPQIDDDTHIIYLFASENHCMLKTFEGVPQNVHTITLDNVRSLESLVGLSTAMRGSLELKAADHMRFPLKTLSGAPQTIGQDFIIRGADIKNLVGGPKEVGGHYCVTKCENLTSLEGLPINCNSLVLSENNVVRLPDPNKWSVSVSGKVDLQNNKLESLQFIHKVFRGASSVDISFNILKSHILGCFLVKGTRSITLANKRAQAIVNSHLRKGRDVFICQDDLIKAGFAEYAQL
jgi:hypothetical protein